MSASSCDCPAGFRYHADNCPTNPCGIRNWRVHEKAQQQERLLARMRESASFRRRVVEVLGRSG